MPKEYFTYDEVNELIPQLEYHFRKLLFHKKEMSQASIKLRRYGMAPQLIGRIPTQAPPEVHTLQMEVRRHYREYKQHLLSIENLGGEIKNLELGRVDFPSKKEGEELVLTWQLGVTDVAFPHPKEESGDDTVEINVDNVLHEPR